MTRSAHALLAAVAAVAAAGAAGAGPPAATPAPQEVRMQGVYRAGFERSSFDDCWLTFSRPALEEWRAHVSRLEQIGSMPRGWGRFDLVLSGTRTDGGRHGHMGAHRCLIRATRIHSVRRLPLRP